MSDRFSNDNKKISKLSQQIISKEKLFKGEKYKYFSLVEIFANYPELNQLPFSMRILLENLVRTSNDSNLQSHISYFINWLAQDGKVEQEIDFYPSRVLMQDFTGVPAIVDLAAMRDAAVAHGVNAKKVNPMIPMDLVIDHSVQVNYFATKDAFAKNVTEEMRQNNERYRFLKWGQGSFENFKVVPPGMGICHQVNLEYLASVIFVDQKNGLLYPETIIGTDSHTTMINGLAVLGWGVGGIEAESVMLGESLSMLLPEVIGFELIGKLNEGVTATDLVLTVTNILRKAGVVGKFVEFYGAGMQNLSLADRATIANMAPEYGATCGFFPIDQKTIDYLRISGRDEDHITLIETHAKEEMLWADTNEKLKFTQSLKLDLKEVHASLAGPMRPQDQCFLPDVKKSLVAKFPEGENILHEYNGIKNGDVVLAAITSCTNTSNPSVLIAAGLLAKKAIEKGLKIKSYVKTSLAPGSRVVNEYLVNSGLQKYLDQLGFNVVGYGCTTCIGNSGPLSPEIEQAIRENDLCVGAVLSGNRNFEGRIQPLIKANYLASPPLVVAFALAGTLLKDLTKESIADNIYLKDIWPTNEEIESYVQEFVKRNLFEKEYAKIFDGEKEWQEIKVDSSEKYSWDKKSTYIKNPPYFDKFNWKKSDNISDVKSAKILAILGDSITTDHISPAGAIKIDSPAGQYLIEHNIKPLDFNSYGSRRGNDQVMIRGTFANVRLKNEMVQVEGGYTIYYPNKSDVQQYHNIANEMVTAFESKVTSKELCLEPKQTSIYEASINYQATNTPLVIFAGKNYGSGSSRDWAAKGTALLGVKAVIAESFERIHRSNLIGMGVIPLIFKEGENRKSLNLTGSEIIDLELHNIGAPKQMINGTIHYHDGSVKKCQFMTEIYTSTEIETILFGGIMQKVLVKLFTV